MQSIITIGLDAMGCQKNLVNNIHAGGADYMIVLKGNQDTLHKRVKTLFAKAEAKSFDAMVYDRYKCDTVRHSR